MIKTLVCILSSDMYIFVIILTLVFPFAATCFDFALRRIRCNKRGFTLEIWPVDDIEQACQTLFLEKPQMIVKKTERAKL